MILKKIKILLFISVTVSCNSNIPEVNCSSLNKEEGKYYLDTNLYSGNCLFFNDGNLAELRSIKKGLHKKTIGYWDTGEVKYTGRMKTHSINGTYKEYYKSGSLAKKGRFKMGYYHGKWTFTREDGKILRITTFNKGKVVSEIDKN